MKKLLPFLLLFACQPNTPEPAKEDCYTCDLVVKITISGSVNESRTQSQFNGIYCGDEVNKAKAAARKVKSEDLGFGVRQTIQEHLECEKQR